MSISGVSKTSPELVLKKRQKNMFETPSVKSNLNSEDTKQCALSTAIFRELCREKEISQDQAN